MSSVTSQILFLWLNRWLTNNLTFGRQIHLGLVRLFCVDEVKYVIDGRHKQFGEAGSVLTTTEFDNSGLRIQ